MPSLAPYFAGCRIARFPHLVRLRGWRLLGWLGLQLLSLTVLAQTRPMLRLDLLTSSPIFDQTYVYFEQGATAGFDAAFDATKLPNSSGLNLASFESGGQQLAINGLPPTMLDTPFSLPLFVGVPADGAYVLQVGQLDNFAAVATVSLTDALLGTSTPLALGTSYTFDLTAANTNGTNATSTRFALQFQPVAMPLPVTLTRFTAEALATSVQVRWATASETNSAYFAVERSRDGRAFAELGRVAAAGTSGQAHDYVLLDQQPLLGVAYYRLHQVDLDGSGQYSPVRLATWLPAAGGLRLFPNPARTTTTLLNAAPQAGVAVHDAQGRLITTAQADAAGRATLQLPAGLASGIYLVRTGTQAIRLTVE